MSPRRIVLLTTVLAALGLSVWLSLASWDSASRVATIVSAVAAVALLGVGVWAALPGASSKDGVRASRTGRAVARGRDSTATSGITATVGKIEGNQEAHRTGVADASDGGEATSGIRLE
jgi:hypothetical protein